MSTRTLFQTMAVGLVLTTMASADLVLTVTATPAELEKLEQGTEPLTLTVSVTNTSDIPVIDLVLSAIIPNYWTGYDTALVPSEWAGGACSDGGQYCSQGETLMWDLGELNPGKSKSLVLTLSVYRNDLPAVGLLVDNAFRANASNAADIAANAQVKVVSIATNAAASVTATANGTVFSSTTTTQNNTSSSGYRETTTSAASCGSGVLGSVLVCAMILCCRMHRCRGWKTKGGC